MEFVEEELGGLWAKERLVALPTHGGDRPILAKRPTARVGRTIQGDVGKEDQGRVFAIKLSVINQKSRGGDKHPLDAWAARTCRRCSRSFSRPSVRLSPAFSRRQSSSTSAGASTINKECPPSTTCRTSGPNINLWRGRASADVSRRFPRPTSWLPGT